MAVHPERVLYTVWALWLVGLSAPTIGKVVARSRKQVLGIVTRSPYPNRSAMAKEERQAALDRLLMIRTGDDGRPIDGGLLDREPRRVMDLRTEQVRRGGPRSLPESGVTGSAFSAFLIWPVSWMSLRDRTMSAGKTHAFIACGGSWKPYN